MGMLVLTRKLGETIVIGGNVRVEILKVSAGQVSIGIDAPRSVTVDREEIHARKEREDAARG